MSEISGGVNKFWFNNNNWFIPLCRSTCSFESTNDCKELTIKVVLFIKSFNSVKFVVPSTLGVDLVT